jgi:mycobactin peptide synthetase MbtE
VPLPLEIVHRVHAVAREVGVTPHMVTLAVFLAVLERWTGCGDLVVGTAVNHRPLPDTEDMIGPFASIIPVRYTVDRELSFRHHLDAVKEGILRAREHENVPFELIVGSLGAAQSAAYNPLVQVTMTYKSGVVQPMKLSDLTVTAIPTQDVDVQRDLAVEISGDHGDYLSVAYSSDLWDRATIDTLVEAYVAALDQATAHLDARLGALRLALPEAPVHQPSPAAPAPAAPAAADAAIEEAVRQAWLEVLEVPEVGGDDDFFELGGESIGAMRICNRLGTALGGRVPLRVLFENSVFADFAAEVRTRAEGWTAG